MSRRSGNDKYKAWTNIIGAVTTEIKLLALVVLVLETSYGITFAVIENNYRIYVFVGNSVLLLILIVGLLIIVNRKAKSTSNGRAIQPSPQTPRDLVVEDLVNTAINAVCRAASLPHSPGTAGLRVFIFKHENGQLVCTHFYSADPTREEVGQTRFSVNAETANTIAVVQAFLDKQVTRKNLDVTGEGQPGVYGMISPKLKMVLASPIMSKDGTVWGTVDFDAATESGVHQLTSEMADATIHALAVHLTPLLASTDPSGIGVDVH